MQPAPAVINSLRHRAAATLAMIGRGLAPVASPSRNYCYLVTIDRSVGVAVASCERVAARAEALLLRSLDTARQQGALAWELRAAISLAELWQRQDRREKALDLLASVQDRFTEGFFTADLVKSAALLRDLRS